MRTVTELLLHLKALDVRLWVDGDRLRTNAPKGAIDAELRAEIGTNREQLMAYLKAGPAESIRAPIVRVSRDAPLPLSFAQERLWFLDQLAPGNPFYNIAIALTLKGRFSIGAMADSLPRLVQRHEVLRATFSDIDGNPVQVIAPEMTIPVPTINLLHLHGDEHDEEVHRLAIEESRKPFDLVAGPLIRGTVLCLGPGTDGRPVHILLLTMHHIVSDGWSMGLVVRELFTIYGAVASVGSGVVDTGLPELDVQYPDFACWQREWFQGDILAKQLAYWKNQLAGATPELAIPADRVRPAAQSFRGSSEQFEVGTAVTDGLNVLSREQGATLFMTLFSAVAVLLYRYSGQDDMVIGSPIANRTRREIESLIGFFVNTLALRVDMSGDPTFLELLARVRVAALDAYAHQDLPFEKLVDEIQPERDLSRNPLFQVMFALQNAPMSGVDLSDLEVGLLETRRVAALFDLVLDVWESNGALIGVMEYNTDLFKQETVAGMVCHFRVLLAAIAENPRQKISELSLVSEEAEQELLAMSCGPCVDYPVQRRIEDLFEEQVQEDPERIAVVHGSAHLTYGALNRRANSIAKCLCDSGVGRGDYVGILDERGTDFLAGMLGILKAGAAFLPIDPSYPEERVSHMVADSRIGTLVTRRGLVMKYFGDGRPGEFRNAVCLDTAGPAADDGLPGGIRVWTPAPHDVADDACASTVGDSHDAAYMLYTSGSTGLPKGAVVRHDGAVNHIFAQYDELEFHRDTAFLQSAPSSSDISVWQFLGPVLIGGRVVIVDFETVCDAEALFTVIKEEGVTVIELVPVVMSEMLQYAGGLPGRERELPALEWAMVTGEAVSVSLVNQWISTYPSVKLANAYGPTEAADDICQFVIDEPLPLETRSVPIGRPLANLTLYVLDKDLRIQPVGVPGEICVSGVGVGAGYWGRDELTRRSFVPNSYDPAKYGDTIYRTGDLGRWLPDGNLEFLGRFDDQVKIRGFRIELGEIEGVLVQHPLVREAVVEVRADSADGEPADDDKRLVAYVVTDSESSEGSAHVDNLQKEQVALWQSLHEDSYSEKPSSADPEFNTVGWDSTYTGMPLSDEEMHEYIDFTVSRVLASEPKRILEIGCGTGLLMFQVAKQCEYYLGTDLSQVAVDSLKRETAQRGLDNVQLVQKEASDFSGIEPGSFDTVMLCSVVQYFPGIDYLLKVLRGAARSLRPGGTIFLGDVRDLSVLAAYHTSVQLHKAGSELTRAELAGLVNEQMAREQELAIDPAFFFASRRRVPEIDGIEILPKRGRIHNEMTRFRCDVILHMKEHDVIPAERLAGDDLDWTDWRIWQPGLNELRTLFADDKPASLALRNVPDLRVSVETRALAWLAGANSAAPSAGGPETVGEFREALVGIKAVGLDPEMLCELGNDLDYDIALSFADSGTVGSLNIVFSRRTDRQSCSPLFDCVAPERAWHEYSNNPLQEKLSSEVIPALRGFLKERVPSHMVPSDFMMMESLPLLPNGKIDRRGLPIPARARAGRSDSYVAPRTEIEQALAGIWAGVLGLEQVGVADNFFDLGGHSLKATQVVSRIHRDLGVEVALRDIFNWPTIEELAAEIGGKAATGFEEIVKVEDAEHYPVSHAQRRLWVLAQMEGGSVAYNMPGSLMLTGELDTKAFEDAFSMLVARHESLRTTFICVDGEPRQKIEDAGVAQVRYVDLRGESDPLESAREFAQRDAAVPFNMETGPLLRISLLKLAETEHVLVFNMHHIISDDWSTNVLVTEFMSRYESIRLGHADALPALRVQYRDYAAWQNAFLASGKAEDQKKYWHSRLAGELPVLDIPTDFARPQVKTYNGDVFAAALGVKRSQAIREFCRRENVSLFMFLVAVTKALLHRYTGQEDMVVGTVIAGRNHTDLEDQIGFYLNTLALRDRVAGSMPFTELLKNVARAAADAYENQDYPFDRLVDELQVNRDVTRSPMFDVMVVLQNAETRQFVLSDVEVSQFDYEYGMSKFDLAFTFEEKDGNLGLDIVYNTDLFLDERIGCMRGHFNELVDAILCDPTEAVEDLAILTQRERERLLTEFNDTDTGYPADMTIAGLFEEQAARTPDASAVLFDDVVLTYAEVDMRAASIAGQLLARGFGAGDLVGVLMARSDGVITTFLGVLKAGCAYVPLDPEYPEDRLSYMIQDSGCRIVLTDAQCGDLARRCLAGPDMNDVCVVVVDGADSHSGRPKESDTSAVTRDPDQPAYVIYTSGSTGRPKGCVVTNRNVVRLMKNDKFNFDFGVKDVWIVAHSFCFDFSVWEMYGALLYGGRVVVARRDDVRNTVAFRELVSKHRVTVLNQTPAAFYNLIEVENGVAQHDLSDHLRVVIFGGDRLQPAHLRSWVAKYPLEKVQLVNMYGITETTVHVTYGPLTTEDIFAGEGCSPVGVPLPETRVYVCDDRMNLQPIGVAGELYVGGTGVSRGYLNRPALTAERFIASPFVDGDRLYASGDLGKWRWDGTLEHFGRNDSQVQLRGFRIELGEIETVLVGIDGVKEAVVIASEDRPGDKRLIAYVVGDGPSLTDAALREQLAGRLTEYMVPSAFVVLDKIPLTSNGKVDRHALPEPGHADDERDKTLPRNELEATIAGVWKDILGVAEVGVDDNFFDIGGHSLGIIRTSNRLKELLGREIPVVELFKYSTISALAGYLGSESVKDEAGLEQVTDRARKRKDAMRRRRRGRTAGE